MKNDYESEFSIVINFNKDSKKPSHIFRVMSELIESFNILDKALISSINFQIEPIILLEDIEKGSIISRFKYLLENIPNEALSDLSLRKLLGHFLIKAKYYIIDFLNNRETIIAPDIEILEGEIIKLSNEAQILNLTTPGSIDRVKLLSGIAKISNAMTQVEEKEIVIYKTDEKDATINLSFSLLAEQIEDLLTAETINSNAEMILKIKKPDYLGDSKWEFRHRKEAINAKISDVDWLTKFRNREITLKPGDSIRGMVSIEVKYDYDREVTAINHNILKVIEVIFAKSNNQQNLFNNGN
jgi:hypothetical protein